MSSTTPFTAELQEKRRAARFPARRDLSVFPSAKREWTLTEDGRWAKPKESEWKATTKWLSSIGLHLLYDGLIPTDWAEGEEVTLTYQAITTYQRTGSFASDDWTGEEEDLADSIEFVASKSAPKDLEVDLSIASLHAARFAIEHYDPLFRGRVSIAGQKGGRRSKRGPKYTVASLPAAGVPSTLRNAREVAEMVGCSVDTARRLIRERDAS